MDGTAHDEVYAADPVPDPDEHLVEYVRAYAATRPPKSDAWAAWGRRAATLAMNALGAVPPNSPARPALVAAVAEMLVEALADTHAFVAEGSLLDGMWEVVQVVGREAAGHNAHAAFSWRQRTECAERRVPVDVAKKIRARRDNLTGQLLALHIRPDTFREQWAETLRTEAQYRPSLLERVALASSEPTVQESSTSPIPSSPATAPAPTPGALVPQTTPPRYAGSSHDSDGNDILEWDQPNSDEEMAV